MLKLVFILQRALFIEPYGMTLGIARRKVRQLFGARANLRPVAGPHPIDLRYGIDTGGFIAASSLRSGNAMADLNNFGYAASQPSIVRTVLATIPELETFAFVDIGSGKGRVLVVASEYPLRSILGIELSQALTSIAAANASRIASRYPERTFIETIAADALAVDLPAGRLVVYFYNPAHAPLLRRLADGIAAHAARPGNHVMLIYYNPASARVFDEHPAFTRYYAAAHECDEAEAASTVWGTSHDSVVIWQSGDTEPLPPHVGANVSVSVVAGGAVGEVTLTG